MILHGESLERWYGELVVNAGREQAEAAKARRAPRARGHAVRCLECRRLAIATDVFCLHCLRQLDPVHLAWLRAIEDRRARGLDNASAQLLGLWVRLEPETKQIARDVRLLACALFGKRCHAVWLSASEHERREAERRAVDMRARVSLEPTAPEHDEPHDDDPIAAHWVGDDLDEWRRFEGDGPHAREVWEP